eukprot:TRINITY_DN37819_c0_g1_i1.p1 TRINITY_DN37819_c0_g1~~TRINITY_DN37819_c0_g1_i1.p1  ORF type:complete len:141 (+),score=31.84 TRINITY_DN37819_c0_g1_i1:182-604(+)
MCIRDRSTQSTWEPVEETLEEYEEEFTEKLHLAQQKSCETRIQFIQKSSLTILQDLLSLEESLSSGVGILEAPTLSMECGKKECRFLEQFLSLIHISEPTRPLYISYAVFCLKKKKKSQHQHIKARETNIQTHQRDERKH